MDPIDNIQKSYSVCDILDDLPLDNLNMTYQPLNINFNQLLLNSWKNLQEKPQENKKKVSYPFFKNVNFDKKSLGINDCFMYDKDEKKSDLAEDKDSEEEDVDSDSSEDSDEYPTGKRKEMSSAKLVHYNNYYGWKKRRVERVELRGDGEAMMGRGVRINDFFI